MTETREFKPHLLDAAPEAARATMKSFGATPAFTPDAVGRLAESPAALNTAKHLFEVFHGTSLTADERETVVFAIARRNGCHVCVAIHSQMMTARRSDPALLAALRSGAPLPTERLEALSAFVRDALDRTGDVSGPIWSRFLEAGYTRAQALEVMIGVAAFTMTTFGNRLVQAKLDPNLLPFAP